MGRRESKLFDFSEIILDVLVEGHSAEWSQRDLLLWPNLGEIEDVPAEFLGLFWREDLNVAGPARVVTLLDGVKEILGIVIWVFCCHIASFGVGEGLVTLIGLHVDLDVVEGSIWLCPLVSMARISVHVSIGVWCTAIAEEVHDLVSSLLMRREVIPEHSCVFEVGLWVALLGVDEERELGRITDEEDRCVVENPIPVALLGIVLNRKASGVSSSIWRAFLTTDRGETSNAASFLANIEEHVNVCDIANVVRDFEFAVCAGTFGMYNTLWNALTIEMGQQIDQVEILEQERAILTNSLVRLWALDGAAIGCGVDWLLVVLKSRCGLVVGHHGCYESTIALENGVEGGEAVRELSLSGNSEQSQSFVLEEEKYDSKQLTIELK